MTLPLSQAPALQLQRAVRSDAPPPPVHHGHPCRPACLAIAAGCLAMPAASLTSSISSVFAPRSSRSFAAGTCPSATASDRGVDQRCNTSAKVSSQQTRSPQLWRSVAAQCAEPRARRPWLRQPQTAGAAAGSKATLLRQGRCAPPRTAHCGVPACVARCLAESHVVLDRKLCPAVQQHARRSHMALLSGEHESGPFFLRQLTCDAQHTDAQWLCCTIWKGLPAWPQRQRPSFPCGRIAPLPASAIP